MKTAFVHYHLKPGGVTTVLNRQIKAVASFGEALVMTGESPVGDVGADVITQPGIAYDTVKKGSYSPKQVAGDILSAIHSRWSDGCDLVHIHNPTLAKNRDFLDIVKELQQAGCRLLLEIHDFAEDGRPGVYFNEAYPRDCHYGVINSRDYRAMLASGLKAEGLHLIPNAVITEQKPLPARDLLDDKFVLYPVRAIRRKNIGEAVLMSLFFTDDLSLWITLPPNSPVDVGSYQFWRGFCKEHDLNVRFEAGLSEDFDKLLLSAHSVITTSIMEGFGFVFIEPWGAGKMIQGRYLQEVCPDFEAFGLTLSNLYTAISIPATWIGWDEFAREWMATMESVAAAFQITAAPRQLQELLSTTGQRGVVDFGLLNEKYQERVMRILVKDRKSRDKLVELNPFLKDVGKQTLSNQVIESNGKLIGRKFTESSFRESLLAVYQKVVNRTVRQEIDKRELVRQFLKPERFSLLKWGVFNG